MISNKHTGSLLASRKTQIASKRTKIRRAPCRKRTGDAAPRAENFGDLMTADHTVLSEGCESRNNHRYALVVQDLATQWTQSNPCKTKTSQETEKSLRKFLQASEKRNVIYTQNFLDLANPVKNDQRIILHQRSINQSETNGIADRAVHRIEGGTSAVPLQSGLDEEWSADSMECYCYLRNVSCQMGKHLRNCDFGELFKLPVIPFCSMVEYHPISPKDQSRLHQCGEKVLLGIFLGCPLRARRHCGN